MAAYYNEIYPYAARWLRNLIASGHIADGEVDDRSIEDVCPDDLRGFTQCHFFAGVGVWSYALRKAGWPAFHHLIEQCRPPVVFGEQVASKDGLAWLDLVQADMEGSGYAFGAFDLCAAGVGAPHIRQRLYWVADSDERQRGRRANNQLLANGQTPGRNQSHGIAESDFQTGGMAESGSERRQPDAGQGFCTDVEHDAQSHGGPCRLGDDDHARLEGLAGHGDAGAGRSQPTGSATETGAVNGFWADADWLPCRDGKWRPVEPGTFPLAHGATARVGRLRAYGNAIVAPLAREFILAYMEG